MFRKFVIGAFCLALVAPGAFGDPNDRVSAVEKGSLLVYPKVEVRWTPEKDQGYVLKQDTFLTLNNDWNANVDIHAYFVLETCVSVDNTFRLTNNQPIYWSALTGKPKGFSPWTVLGDPYKDPEGSPDIILRGYIVLWAVDDDPNQVTQIRWNHLYGGATIVDYINGTAWEYNAYTFQVVNDSIANGDPVGTAGEIKMDGKDYAYGFSQLLLDFYATGSRAFAIKGYDIIHDTDLTLMILSQDLRQDSNAPYYTKAKFDIWNSNEVGLSEQYLCLLKWDQRRLYTHGGHFLVENLQTDKGRARVTGMKSTVCDRPPYMITDNYSLLGVASKYLIFGRDGDDPRVVASGGNLFGSGKMAATILYDPPTGPPEIKMTLSPGFEF